MALSRLGRVLVGSGLVVLAGCANQRGASQPVTIEQSLRSSPSSPFGSSRQLARRWYPSKLLPSNPGRLEPSLATPVWEEVGRSVQGRPLEAIRLGTGSRRVLLIGSIHGNEGEGVPLVERFVEYLEGNPSLLTGRTVLVVRDANPDGNLADTRTNANGVDLNRNFPAENWKQLNENGRLVSGTSPESEPETRALVDLLDTFAPHRIVVVHSTGGEPMVNYDGPATELAHAMSRENGYEVTDYIGYATPGSFGSYAGIDRRLPIITLELRRGIGPWQAWQENRDALVAAVRFSGTGSSESWAK